MEGRGPRAAGASDNSHSFHGVKLTLGDCQFVRGQASGMGMDWGTLSRNEVFHTLFGGSVGEDWGCEFTSIGQDIGEEVLGADQGRDAGHSEGTGCGIHRSIGAGMDEATSLEVDEQGMGPEEVSSEKWSGDICDCKSPLEELIPKSKGKCASAEGADWRAVGGDEGMAPVSVAQVMKRRREDTDIGPCVNKEAAS